MLEDSVFARLSAVRALMDAAYAEPLTVDDLAGRAGMSSFHFVRSFRRAFAVTPHAYLTSIRIARAKELLIRAGSTVTDVCFDVGFQSVGSFSALFARRVGVPPSVYRRVPCFFLRNFGEAPPP